MSMQSTVLVVDPNPSTAQRVQEALAGSGYAVVSARDAVEAQTRAEGVDLAVVLASASLPRGNGYDLARELRDRHPASAVFLLAGGFEVYNNARADEAGVAGQIRKPVTADGLRAHLELALGPISRDGGDDDLTTLEAAAVEPLVGTSPVGSSSAPVLGRPPASDERVASFLARDYQQLEPVAVDPEVIGPALERAILEVLPEVVQRVLRHTLATDPAFRDLVEHAVDEAVRTQLPELVEHIASERLREQQQGGSD
ncbi:MAG: response regulator [Alphaproteobacteria bacterium]|nr:response regulator [Alphaproteobacteria bacterium]